VTAQKDENRGWRIEDHIGDNEDRGSKMEDGGLKIAGATR